MTRYRYLYFCLILLALIGLRTAWSSGTNFNVTDSPAPTSSGGNFGFGTTTPQAKLAVIGGNVGLGTWTAAARLDTDGIRLSTNPASGYVLVSGSTGIGTWMAASTLATTGGAASGWSTGTGTVYATTGSDKVGIGTSTPQGGFVVTNGNVGIGTWVTSKNLLNISGGVGIGTIYAGNNTAPTNGAIIQGYVGIGTITPNNPFVIASNGLEGLRVTDYNIIYGSQLYAMKGYVGGRNGYTLVTDIEHSIGGSYSAAFNGFTTGNDTVGAFHAGVASCLTSKNCYGLINLTTATPYWAAEAPTALSTGYYISGVGFAGQSTGGGATGQVIGASILGNVDGTVGSGVLPTALVFHTSQTNSSGLTERLRITSSGNVGVGTVNPKSFLVVAGGVGIGTNYNSAFIQNIAPGGALIVENNVGIGTYAPIAALDTSGIRLSTNPASGYVLVSGSTGIGTWMAPETLTASSSSQWFTTAGVGIGTYDNVGIGTSTPQGAFVVTNGNVGIGTWAPNTNLRVVGSVGIGTSGSFINIAPTSGSLYVQNSIGIGTFNTWTLQNGTSFKVNHSSSAGSGISTAAIFSNTSSATYARGIEIDSSKAGTFLALGLWNASSDPRAATEIAFGSNMDSMGGYPGSARITGSTYLAFGTGPSYTTVSERLRILSNGNIGIGTTVPAALFTIAGGGVGIGTNYNSAFIQNIAPSGSLIVENNVGIGTYAPIAALDTSGIRLSTNPASGYVLVSGSTGIGTWMAASTLATSGGGTPGGSASQLQFNNAGSFDGVANGAVDSNGNIGIGTVNTQNTLQVLGNIGIGTIAYSSFLSTAAPRGGMLIEGNVGIGSLAPGSLFQVNGGTTGGDILLKAGRGSASGSAPFGAYLSLGSGNVTGVSFSVGTLSGGNGNNGWDGGAMTVTGGSYQGGSGQGGYAIFKGVKKSLNLGGDVVINGGSYTSGYGDVFLSPYGGNVGVGTVTASSKLVLVGGVGIGTGINSAYVNAVAPVGQLIIEGNLGIGTTTPQTKLSVLGNVGIGTWTSALAALSFRQGTTLASGINFGNDTTLYRSDVGTLTTDGFLVSGYSYAVGYVVTPSLKGGFFPSENLTLDSTNDGTKGNVLINPTGGNVGIGTTVPGVKLSVIGGNVGIGTAASFSSLQVGNLITTTSEYDNGTQGSGFTLDWNRGNKQKVTMSASYTITMTPPASGVASLLLKVVQDGTGGWTPTLAGGSGVKWSDSTAPTFTATASSTDIITCYYDGAYYWCTASLNFGP